MAVVEIPSTAAALDESAHEIKEKPCKVKLGFAATLIGQSAAGLILNFSKDIYLINLGADTTGMSIVVLVLAVLVPVCFPVSGFVMDKGAGCALFPLHSWGRRAPWFLTHNLGTVAISGLIYLPPSMDPIALCWLLLA